MTIRPHREDRSLRKPQIASISTTFNYKWIKGMHSIRMITGARLNEIGLIGVNFIGERECLYLNIVKSFVHGFSIIQ
jgi:hypothetical protein